MITVIIIFLIFFKNAIQGLKFFSETDSLLDVVQAGHKAGLARQWLEKRELMLWISSIAVATGVLKLGGGAVCPGTPGLPQ